jgi:hypothetical protein
MTSDIYETIKRIPDSTSAEIDISTDSGQVFRLNCIFKESESPNFFLVFPPKKLPDDIDTNKVCPVAIKSEKAALTLIAKIEEMNGDRTLHLHAQKKINPKSLREYFRVDSKVPVTADYYQESLDGKSQSWTIEGKTLDISGCGVLTVLPEEPLNIHKIELKLSLNGGQDVVSCTGHVIRTKRLHKGGYQVAFHFDCLEPKCRDTIISFCLREQRNRLREKVQTSN